MAGPHFSFGGLTAGLDHQHFPHSGKIFLNPTLSDAHPSGSYEFSLPIVQPGLPIPLFLSSTVETSCFCPPAVDDGKEHMSLKALRRSESAGAHEKERSGMTRRIEFL